MCFCTFMSRHGQTPYPASCQNALTISRQNGFSNRGARVTSQNIPNIQNPLQNNITWIYYMERTGSPLRWQKRPKQKSPTMLSNRMTIGAIRKMETASNHSRHAMKACALRQMKGSLRRLYISANPGATDENKNTVPFLPFHVD